jgi:hypothetical protein
MPENPIPVESFGLLFSRDLWILPTAFLFMYGMVNKAVQEMVCMHYGEPVWEEIKARAGVDVELFFGNESYPDDMTYRLVTAGSQVLHLPQEKVLEAFGEHWVVHTANGGFEGLMRAAGKTLPEFLRNLPNFHDRVCIIFPKLQPPRFTISEVTEHSLSLHYFSDRPGLTSFVVGLLRGLGKMFGSPVQVQVLQSKAMGADKVQQAVGSAEILQL